MTTDLVPARQRVPARQHRTKKPRVSKQPPPAAIPEFVSPRQGASIFGVSPWTMRELVRLGLIQGKRFGVRRVLVHYQSGLEYFSSLPDAKTTRPVPAE
jgi:hypothetical protein